MSVPAEDMKPSSKLVLSLRMGCPKASTGTAAQAPGADQGFSERKHTRVIRVASLNAQSDSVGVGWGLRPCNSDQFPGGAVMLAHGPGLRAVSQPEQH